MLCGIIFLKIYLTVKLLKKIIYQFFANKYNFYISMKKTFFLKNLKFGKIRLYVFSLEKLNICHTRHQEKKVILVKILIKKIYFENKLKNSSFQSIKFSITQTRAKKKYRTLSLQSHKIQIVNKSFSSIHSPASPHLVVVFGEFAEELAVVGLDLRPRRGADWGGKGGGIALTIDCGESGRCCLYSFVWKLSHIIYRLPRVYLIINSARYTERPNIFIWEPNPLLFNSEISI